MGVIASSSSSGGKSLLVKVYPFSLYLHLSSYIESCVVK